MRNKIILGLLGILLFSSLVFAFGVGNTDQTVYVMPGEGGTIDYVLMNGEDNDIFVKSELSYDGGVASISESDQAGFIIPAGSTKVFSLDVNVPEGAALGDAYLTQIIFTTTPGSIDGSPTGGLGMGVRVYSTVVVGEFEQKKINLVPPPVALKVTPESPTINWLLIVIILVVVLLIAMLAKRKKKK